MGVISGLDLNLLERMEDKVLKRAPKGMHPRRTVYVGCPDCDKLKDNFRHHGTSIGQKPHPVGAIHGGGAAFHTRSPLNGEIPFPMAWFCKKIDDAFNIKETSSVSWYIHVPCGAAYASKLNIVQLIELSLYNRGNFIEYMALHHPRPRMEVTPYIHIAYDGIKGHKIRETRVIDLAEWLEFRDEVEVHLRSLPLKLPIVRRSEYLSA